MRPVIKDVRDALGQAYLVGHARDGQEFIASAHGILSPTALRLMLRGRIAEYEDDLDSNVWIAVWPSTDDAGNQVLIGSAKDGTVFFSDPVVDNRCLTIEAMRMILRGKIVEYDDEHGNGER